MKKKVFILLPFILVLLIVIIIMFSNDERFSELSYTLCDNETSYSVTYKGKFTTGNLDYVIPETYKGLPVTAIGKSAFYGCTGLKSITIPDTVTSIDSFAFTDCTNLKAINYAGTEEQWEDISKGSYWDDNTGDYTINFNYKGK